MCHTLWHRLDLDFMSNESNIGRLLAYTDDSACRLPDAWRAGPVTDPSHRSTAAGPPAASVESEYRRHGTLAYLAACDVHHARVIGCCASTTGIAPFTALVTKVMTQQSYARRVFWIADNGASHRGWTAAARLSEQFPNAIMVHIPLHASWLNQVDLLLRRPTQTPHPDDIPNLSAPAKRLAAFETRYNAAARPFDWRFIRNDLDQLLDPIAA